MAKTPEGHSTVGFDEKNSVNKDFGEDDEQTTLLVSEAPVKDNSIQIIFSLWSVMIGSTVLAMPSMTRETGIYAALGGTAFICMINTYSAVIMEKLGTHYQGDCPHVLRQFGKGLYYSTTPPSVLIFVGALILYQTYVCDAIMEIAHLPADSTKWRPIVSCAIGGLMFLVGLLKSIRPLIILASYMVIVVTFMLVFIIVKSGWEFKHDDSCHTDKDHGMGWNGVGPVVELLSAMSLSLFCHNMICSVTNECTNRKAVTRNIIISFIATACSNIGPAVMAVVAFRKCGKIAGDFPDMFEDPFATAARVGISILVCVIYPILLFNARSQTLQVLFGETYSYASHVIFNIVCLAICTAPVAFHMATGAIAAIAGVFAIVFTILAPFGMWIIHNRRHYPSKCTTGFYVLHGLLIAFGVFMMVFTILSVAGVKVFPS